jgi:hypothetical protein
MANDQVDLLIVTPREFQQSVTPLQAHKNSTGIATRVLVLEDVVQQHQGRDDAEKVKRCLAAHRTDHGIRYAMLVGDCDKFPVRYTKTDRKDAKAHDTAFLPADLYYADLFRQDGRFDDWDRNKNGYFGELRGESTAGTVNVDDVDLRPDIAVGRVPASTAGEVSTYVSKVISYERGALGTAWSRTALLIATIDWIEDACKTMDHIADEYLINHMTTLYKLYAAGNPCASTPVPSGATINTRLNGGVGLVAYAGHGTSGGWHGCYSTGNLPGLTNTQMLPVVFAAACSTAEFATVPPYDTYWDVHGNYHYGTRKQEFFLDTPPQPACLQPVHNTEGLAEHMTVKRATGAVGYVGCVTGAQEWGLDLMKYFFEALDLGHHTLGGMWNYMIQRYYEVLVPPLVLRQPNWYRVAEWHQPWKFFLMGDPSLRVGGIPRPVQEDCLRLDPGQARVERSGNRWSLVTGSSIMRNFDDEAEARAALRIIKHYGLNRHCYVGRPDPSMEYFLVDGAAPVGALSGEDCIGFNPAALRLVESGGEWTLQDADHPLMTFEDRKEARAAFDIIQKYGFNHICFVGRPNPPFHYFRR